MDGDICKNSYDDGLQDFLMGEQSICNFNINFGFQYLVVYGVLCMVLELDGEIVECVDLYIGLLYCGIEKLMESCIYLQNLFYLDWLDYVVLMNQEYVWCLVIE